jgi:hypothetical protein
MIAHEKKVELPKANGVDIFSQPARKQWAGRGGRTAPFSALNKKVIILRGVNSVTVC